MDDGAHWQSLKLNLPPAWVNDLLVHDNDLIAATQGRALWVLDDVSRLRQLQSSAEAVATRLFTPATRDTLAQQPEQGHTAPARDPARHESARRRGH